MAAIRMVSEIKIFLKHQFCLQMPFLLMDLLEILLTAMLPAQSMSVNRAVHLGTVKWVQKRASSIEVACRLSHQLGATNEKI